MRRMRNGLMDLCLKDVYCMYSFLEFGRKSAFWIWDRFYGGSMHFTVVQGLHLAPKA